jgi:hypothetical protein
MINRIKEDKELWDLYTRKEEYSPGKLDKYGRFPYSASQNKNILEPKVSEYLIRKHWKINYPMDRKFAVCLTHDIDIINLRRKEYLWNSADALKTLDGRRTIANFMAGAVKKNSPLKNFGSIMSLEEKYGAKSSFYFLALKKEDDDYNYGIAGLKDEFRQITQRGWEVGLHGGHSAYDDPNIILEEKRRLEDALGSKVAGYRNHYLRFKTPNTWEHLSKAGFKYDSTFGYAETAGFRNGMCHPFKPFNVLTGKEIEIIEIPLVIMDRTFLSYMNLNLLEAWNLTKRLIDVTEKNNGVITVLWHNNQMSGGMKRFYEKILGYCRERNAWMTSGNEICDWWIKEQKNIM